MFRQLAKTGKFSQVEQFLRQHSPIPQDEMANALAGAAFRGDIFIVKLLLENGANPNICPSEHLLPIFCAVEQEDCEITRLLVSYGADINIAPEDIRCTPLHWAVSLEGDIAWQNERKPSDKITKCLLSLGANPLLKDHKGKTPLDIAEYYQHDSAIELLKAKIKEQSNNSGC